VAMARKRADPRISTITTTVPRGSLLFPDADRGTISGRVGMTVPADGRNGAANTTFLINMAGMGQTDWLPTPSERFSSCRRQPITRASAVLWIRPGASPAREPARGTIDYPSIRSNAIARQPPNQGWTGAESSIHTKKPSKAVERTIIDLVSNGKVNSHRRLLNDRNPPGGTEHHWADKKTDPLVST